jgi:hypothetical protein
MTITHASNEEIIGRSEINDIEAILSVVNTDPNAQVVRKSKDWSMEWFN